jgi:uncharacterized RDD family membrane protein YckC
VIETASWRRRFLALFVDWIASSLAVVAVLGPDALAQGSRDAFWVYAVFVVESAVLTHLLGGSFGKLMTRLRVVRVDKQGQQIPAPVGVLPALLRSVLIILVIPPLVFKPDGRGLHDLITGTATVALARS